MDEPQGNGAPQAPQGTGAPEAPNDKQTPAGISLEDVNRAITARNQAFEKKLEAKLGELTGGITKSLEAKLAELLPKAPADDTDAAKAKGEGDDKGDKSKAPPKDPEVIALKSELTKIKNQMLDSERRAQAEVSKRRDVEMRQFVTEKLAAHGIDGARAKHALGYLVDVAKTVSLDESGNVSFRGSDGDIDVETGIKGWVATDEAKIYLPPRGTTGSGDRSFNGSNRPPNAPRTERELLEDVIAKAHGFGG